MRVIYAICAALLLGLWFGSAEATPAVCYPGVSSSAYPRWFPVNRYAVVPSVDVNTGVRSETTVGEYWLWYCWDGAKWLGYYRVRPWGLGPTGADWETQAAQWLLNLQGASDPKSFVDAALDSWEDKSWTCVDQIANAGKYGVICKQASDYVASHFPPPREVVPPPAPVYTWFVKFNSSFAGDPNTSPVYNITGGVKGAVVAGARATYKAPCDPTKGSAPSGTSKTQQYAAFGPAFDPTRGALCTQSP